MAASHYDIKAEQGTTFKLHLLYSTEGVGINLSGFTSRMQVRRSYKNPKILLQLGTNGLTGGGSTGEFLLGGGVVGTGGIILNASTLGVTGTTGGIYLAIDSVTMSKVPEGRHVYDLELLNASGEVQRLIQGVFDVPAEITRS